jgi:hypothetical protein
MTLFLIKPYISSDDCFKGELNDQDKNSCLKAYMEFYSYKLVKSMFNFAKTSVYAGLWASRYVRIIVLKIEKNYVQTIFKRVS